MIKYNKKLMGICNSKKPKLKKKEININSGEKTLKEKDNHDINEPTPISELQEGKNIAKIENSEEIVKSNNETGPVKIVEKLEVIQPKNIPLGKPIEIQFINILHYRFSGFAIFYAIDNGENPKKEQRGMKAYYISKNSLIDLDIFYFIRHGEGKLRTPPNPSIVEIKGEWLNDVLHPNFTLSFPLKLNKHETKGSIVGKDPMIIKYKNSSNDSEYYEYLGGQYHGMKQGTGTLKLFKTDENGDIILITQSQGRWMHDCLHGPNCIIESNDGSYYEGGIYLGVKHGYGELRYPNGDFFKGNFNYGVKEGFGILEWGNGFKYEGGWQDDFWKGHGILYQNDEIIEEKKWELELE